MKKDFKVSGGGHFGMSTPDRIARMGTVVGVIFVLLVLSAFPVPFLGLGEICPVFLLIAVYYWAIFKPQVLPPAGAFLAGFLLDLLSAYPAGMNAFLFVLVQWMVTGQRRFLLSQNFAVIWASFTLVAFIFSVVRWAVFSLFEFHLMPIKPVVIAALMTAVVYPLVVMPLFGLNRRLDRR